MAPRGASNWRRPYTSIYNDNYKYGTGLYSDTLSDIEKRYSESMSKTQLRSDRPDLTFTAFSGSNLTSSASPAGDSGSRERPVFTRQVSSPMPEITRSPTFENRLNATLKSAAYALDEDLDEVIKTRIEKRKQAVAKSLAEAKAVGDEEEDDFRRRLEIRKQAFAKSAAEAMAADTEEDDDFRRRMEIRRQALARSTSEVKSKTTDSEEYVVKSKKTTSDESTKPSLYDDYSLWTLPKTSDKLAQRDLDMPKSRRKAGGRQTPTNGPSSQWRDKSRDLQDQVGSLEKSMSDGSTRLKSELSTLKSKYHTELSDLSGSVENTTQQASDLQRLCKRQTNQLQDLQSAYDSAQRNIQDTLEEMSVWQNKCKSLKKEMDRLRDEVEIAVNKRSKA